MNIRHRVELHQSERDELTTLLAGGRQRVRRLKRAQILLAADRGASDAEIAERVVCGISTVTRTKRRFVEGGLEPALSEARRSGVRRKLTGREEALLVATACSNPPAGRARWTLELLCGEMVRLTEHESLSRETVRRRLSENDLKPWRKDMWCIPKVDAAFVAAMEDVLDLYNETPDPNRPVVCFDESPVQLIGETRTPVPARPGQPRRFDHECRRNGTANLFVAPGTHRGWRKVKVTERRTATDFAACMRELSDVHFPEADRIRVVLDNLSTHTPASLYNALPAEEARRILRRIEFHYTPKHASWLNMVEIEIGVLQRQCLSRRIPDRATLETETAAWEKQRNASKAQVNWTFTAEKAKDSMARAYPKPDTSKTSDKPSKSP
ncbi:MAG: IS630 family transposase [Boseongicola sp. SB0673_bin_14]|nr:IS630 family transposase [Boseongicola sp. SB0667_bin_21]MYI69926.1 IS630 family transposase [Boseongicola sp. SB0673_bin_14]